jgi:hypothetical protein
MTTALYSLIGAMSELSRRNSRAHGASRPEGIYPRQAGCYRRLYEFFLTKAAGPAHAMMTMQ